MTNSYMQLCLVVTIIASTVEQIRSTSIENPFNALSSLSSRLRGFAGDFESKLPQAPWASFRLPKRPSSTASSPSSPETGSRAELDLQNTENVRSMFALIESDGWEPVVSTSDTRPIHVWKKKLPPGTHGGSSAADDVAAEKHACIKATAVIDAPPEEVYKLFLDNERVHEYNEHCEQLADVERLSGDTKVAWSATAPFGPFKPRDFVTLVHTRGPTTRPEAPEAHAAAGAPEAPEAPEAGRRLAVRRPPGGADKGVDKGGVYMAVNRPARHPDRPPTARYQRAEVLLAGNVMEPVAGEPGRTRLTLITHINPGGVVDNALGAAICNRISATSPVDFIRRLEIAAGGHAAVDEAPTSGSATKRTKRTKRHRRRSSALAANSDSELEYPDEPGAQSPASSDMELEYPDEPV